MSRFYRWLLPIRLIVLDDSPFTAAWPWYRGYAKRYVFSGSLADLRLKDQTKE